MRRLPHIPASLHQAVLNPWVYSFFFSTMWLEFSRSWRQGKNTSDYLQEYLPQGLELHGLHLSRFWAWQGHQGNHRVARRLPGERRASKVFSRDCDSHGDYAGPYAERTEGTMAKLWLRIFALFFFLLVVSLISHSRQELKF